MKYELRTVLLIIRRNISPPMYPYGKKVNRNRAALALGDVVTVLVFVALGNYHHGSTDPLHVVYVAVPFLFGWFAVAPLAGAYGRFPSVKNEAFSLLGIWLVAALVGLAVRATDLFMGGAHPSFGFVMVVVGGAAFLVWRLGIARLIL